MGEFSYCCSSAQNTHEKMVITPKASTSNLFAGSAVARDGARRHRVQGRRGQAGRRRAGRGGGELGHGARGGGVGARGESWPLHDIAITNIVCCMAYKGGVSGGGVYCAMVVR